VSLFTELSNDKLKKLGIDKNGVVNEDLANEALAEDK